MASLIGKAIMSFLGLVKSRFRSSKRVASNGEMGRRAWLAIESLEVRDVPATITLSTLASLIPAFPTSNSTFRLIESPGGPAAFPPAFRQDFRTYIPGAGASLEANSPLPIRAAPALASVPSPPLLPAHASSEAAQRPGGEFLPFFAPTDSFFASLQAAAGQSQSFLEGMGADLSEVWPPSAPGVQALPVAFLDYGKQPLLNGVVPPFMLPGALPRFGEAGDGVANFPPFGPLRMMMPLFFSIFGRQLPVTMLFPLPATQGTEAQQDSIPPTKASPSDDSSDSPLPATPPTSNISFAIVQRNSESSALLDLPSEKVRSVEKRIGPATLPAQSRRIASLAGDLLSPVFEPAILADLLVPEIAPVMARSLQKLSSFIRESVFATGDVSGAGQFEGWQKLAAAAALAGLVEAVRIKRRRGDWRFDKRLEIPGITGPAGLT